MSVLRGRIYNRRKKAVPNPEGAGGKSGKIVKGQNDLHQSTAEQVAKAVGISGNKNPVPMKGRGQVHVVVGRG